MTLGNRIAQYRKKLSITQDALAQQLDVTNQAVSKWESDQCCPDVMLLPKLADIFGISIDELFGRQTEPANSLPWPDDNVLRVYMYVGHRLVGGGPDKEGYEFHYHDSVDGIISHAIISCGDVMGNVKATGSVNCGKVYGSVYAGTDATCGDVMGSVDAGCHITCGNVSGNVDAGCNVECGNVEGDVDAGACLTIRK